jgi:hypothetical protein
MLVNMSPTRALLLVSVLAIARGAAATEDVVEESTGHKFPTSVVYDGKPYALLGVGVRKKVVVKVYAMALYGEVEGGNAVWPAIMHSAGVERAAKIAETPFPKLAVLVFQRDVDWQKIQEAYKESLEPLLSERAPADLRRAAQEFVGLFGRDMKEGQEIRIHTDAGGQIIVELAGAKKLGPRNVELVRAGWGIWLGRDPISDSLREGLVRYSNVLGRSPSGP